MICRPCADTVHIVDRGAERCQTYLEQLTEALHGLSDSSVLVFVNADKMRHYEENDVVIPRRLDGVV